MSYHYDSVFPFELFSNIILDTNIASRICHDNSKSDQVNKLRKTLRDFILLNRKIYIHNSSVSELMFRDDISAMFLETLGVEFSAEYYEDGVVLGPATPLKDVVTGTKLEKIENSLSESEFMALKVLRKTEELMGFSFTDCSRTEAAERFFSLFPLVPRDDEVSKAKSIEPFLFGSHENKMFQIFIWLMIHGIGGVERGKFPLNKKRGMRNILNDFSILSFTVRNNGSVLLTSDKALSGKTNIFCREFNQSCGSVLVSGVEILD